MSCGTGLARTDLRPAFAGSFGAARRPAPGLRVMRRGAMVVGSARRVLRRLMGRGMLAVASRPDRNRRLALRSLRGGCHPLPGEGGRVVDPRRFGDGFVGKI